MAGTFVTEDGHVFDAQTKAFVGIIGADGQLVYIPSVSKDLTGNATKLVGPTGDFLVVSSAAPVNADGRPDGVIYIQTV